MRQEISGLSASSLRLQALKPFCIGAHYGTAEQFAEKLEKQIPLRLKPGSG
jgi:hypothetical protein